MSMQKQLDFKRTQAKARQMSIDALNYAIKDCRECVSAGCDPDYYRDEMSVYLLELNKRK